jgi:hypothetical protein
MKGAVSRVLLLAALGVLVTIGVANAQGGRVDLFGTHWRCYIISQQTPQPAVTVSLEDQFFPEGVSVDVSTPLQFCAPASKQTDLQAGPLPVPEEETHLTMYLAPHVLAPNLQIDTRDQFGEHTLEATNARVLLVPTAKTIGGTTFPITNETHYWCYDVSGPRVGARVLMNDQFGSDVVRIEEPQLFCNPATKTFGGTKVRPEDRETHLTCYEVKGPNRAKPFTFGIQNQLETDTFQITSYELVCAPTEKLGFTVEAG